MSSGKCITLLAHGSWNSWAQYVRKWFWMLKALYSAAFTVQAALGSGLYDLGAVTIEGQSVSLSQYQGLVSVVVNVATF